MTYESMVNTMDAARESEVNVAESRAPSLCFRRSLFHGDQVIFGKRSAFGRIGRRRWRHGGSALNLTALMDIFSNLLFFLLASYTAQSVEVEGQSGLKLQARQVSSR